MPEHFAKYFSIPQLRRLFIISTTFTRLHADAVMMYCQCTMLQAAIVSLATHVLQHPDTLNEVNKLAKDVIALLVKGMLP